MQKAIYAGSPAVTDVNHRPPFGRALVLTISGLLLALGLVLLVGMLWQGISSTRESARQQIDETLNRSLERLQLLIGAARMTTASARRAALSPPVGSATLRFTLENVLAAFEQRPELSYLGIALPVTGEYGCLERTDDGTVLLWLYPGARREDPVTRVYVLTRHGFTLRDARPNDGYDPRAHPFYQAGLSAPADGAWMPVYPWVIHGPYSPHPWGLSFVQALHDDAGHLLGILDTDLDLPALNRFVGSLDAEYQTRLRIIELGTPPRLIAGPGVERTPLDLPPGLPPLAISGREFTGSMRLNGQRRWVAARRLDLSGGVSWLVIASQPDPVISMPMRRQLYQVLGAGLATVALLTLASMRMARHLARPLAELEQRATRIEHNGPEALQGEPPTAIGKFRETQRLCQAFDRMAMAMQQRTRELLTLNAELEQRVAHRTRDLQYLNQELETFSYSVSHDLRAPLRGIAGFTQIIARDHAGALVETARHYLDRVLAAAQRMGELIDDLLNLSRVSREQMHRTTVDLSAMARAILAELQQSAPERRVQIQVQDGLHADADSRLLRIALENLLGNAWKFTARSTAPRIDFTASSEGGSPGFAVSDNGAGFDSRYAGKLFGPFQRLHRMEEFPGTGIGLATVQRIIARHGGRITARGEPGKGATFWFTLEQGSA